MVIHLALIFSLYILLKEGTHKFLPLLTIYYIYLQIYIMSNSESITNNRLSRLALNKCLLGEPDIICIKQIKSSSSFFNKDKKIEDTQQNFINGLIFPTTAHFSSFISTRYKARDPTKLTIKAKLFMFDAYGEKDIHIQISIPGSLEVKTFNLKGQPLQFQKFDYQKAYYSSFLRSLYPMNYPNIILYPLLNRIQILKPIIKNLISFSFKHELRQLDYDFDIYRDEYHRQNEQKHNLSIEILINYCIENEFTYLIKVILEELKKYNLAKYYQTQFRFKIKQKKYQEIISKTSQKLLLHGQAKRLKEHQIRALYPAKKFAQISFIGRTLIQSGGTTEQISKLILKSLIEINEDKKFLKTLNLISNLHNQNQKKINQVSHHHHNNNVFQLAIYVSKSAAISEYPQLCFPFDNQFLNRLVQYRNQLSLLKKNTREGFTLGVLEKVEETLASHDLFYDILILYQKQRGWKSLLKCRGQCFWLETDFNAYYEEGVKGNNNTHKSFNDNYSFFDQSFQDRAEQAEFVQKQFQDPNQKQSNDKENQQQIIQEQAKDTKMETQSFDGNLSQHEEQKQVLYMPKLSTRVYTARKPSNQKKVQSKILCGSHLQKLFIHLFNDIRLQNSLQNWQQKLKQSDSDSFTAPKKQLAALISLKKGFLHKKLMRNKKCEQAFKLARKLSNSYAINIVAVYQLILLYIDNKNVRGVQFYLIEIIKLLKLLGIQTFDIIPEWAKPILQFVIDNQGITILKNIHPLFKSVFTIYLRSNYTEEEVEKYTQVRKDRKNDV